MAEERSVGAAAFRVSWWLFQVRSQRQRGRRVEDMYRQCSVVSDMGLMPYREQLQQVSALTLPGSVTA